MLCCADTSKRAATLVSHGTTHALFVILAEESKSSDTSDELLMSIHQLLSKLAQKGTRVVYMYVATRITSSTAYSPFTDRKFGVKARLTNALPVTVALLKQFNSSPRMLQSIVPVIKQYSNNGGCCTRCNCFCV